MPDFTRRAFLKTAGLATAALTLPISLAANLPQTGMPAPSAPLLPEGPKKKILIVGAGLAGLVAGYELDRAGHDVTILEAQLRPGGRVLTLRDPFSDGLYAEAGAARILDTHDLTIRYAHDLQLKLVPFYPSSGQFLNQVAGQRVVGPVGAGGRWPAALTATEQKLGTAGMWRKYVFDVVKQIGNPAQPGWSAENFANYDSVTFLRFLRRRGASPGAMRVMTLGADFDGASALRILADLAVNGNVTQLSKIDGGNDRLPLAFAARLSRRIHYGAAVQKIEQNKTGVRASFLQGTLLHSLAADRLICTVPFPVLRRVNFDPPVSDEKQGAIDTVYYLSAARVICQEQRRFWNAAKLNGFALSDWPIEVWQPTFDQPGERGLLSGYLEGEMSRRISNLPEDRRVETLVNELETIFPGTRANFEGAATKCWDTDYWALGAAQWFRPGQMTTLGPYMATPEGRVHFAGEHTSPWPAWMQGALHSGLRAAREVVEAKS